MDTGDVDGDGSEDLITINRAIAPASSSASSSKSASVGSVNEVAVRLNVSGVFCPSDTNGDGTVNVFDLLSLLGAWGSWGVCP